MCCAWYNGFVFQIVGKIVGGTAQEQEGVVILLTIGLGSYAVFLFISVGAMIGKIFTQTHVTKDIIRGGIAVYFLLGIFWACLFTACCCISILRP